MRPKIYRYDYNNKTYYAEGYNEIDVRALLESYLLIPKGTLKLGKAPDFKKELKLIWDKNNKTHFLTLKKENTTSRKQLQLYKKKQHCLYELQLLLREDIDFLNGHQGHVIANEENQVKFWNSKYIKSDGTEIGHEMCYSFKGSTDSEMTNKIYRFKNLATAYKYVRKNIIDLGIADIEFNRNFTNLEMCDSFIAGFGSADLISVDHPEYGRTFAVKADPELHDLKDFKIK